MTVVRWKPPPHDVIRNPDSFAGVARSTYRALTSFGWGDVIDLGGISTARATEMMVKIRLLVMTSLGTPVFNFKIAR